MSLCLSFTVLLFSQDTRSGQLVKKLRGFHPLIAVHIERDMIVCGDQEGSIVFYDLRKGADSKRETKNKKTNQRDTNGQFFSLFSFLGIKTCPSISIRASIRDIHFDATKLVW